jgi:hypothetical protein
MKNLLFLLIVSTVFCQYSQPFQSEEIELGLQNTSSAFFDENKFTMSHGLTFVSSFGNNVSGSTGVFSNYMNYQINPNMKLHGNFHLVKPSYSINGNQFQSEFNVQYDIGLDYKFSDNVFFSLQFRNSNGNYFSNNQHPWGN